MPGRGGSGNFKAAVKNVDKQTSGSVRSATTTTNQSISSSEHSTRLATKAGITIVQRPALPTLKSSRRGFAHTTVATSPALVPPLGLPTPSLSKHDFGDDYLGRNGSSIGFSTSADADSIEPALESPTIGQMRAGRGGLGNAMHAAVKDNSGQSIISSVSGGSLKDKLFGSELGVTDAQSRAIWITTTITVDYSPAEICDP